MTTATPCPKCNEPTILVTAQRDGVAIRVALDPVRRVYHHLSDGEGGMFWLEDGGRQRGALARHECAKGAS